jgi:hypothetical protein
MAYADDPVPLAQCRWAKLIMKASPVPDAMNPDFQCVGAQWIRGFMTFRRGRPAPGVMPTVPV